MNLYYETCTALLKATLNIELYTIKCVLTLKEY